MHLDQILVSPGQDVYAGCVIGYMGHTGGNADQTNPSMGIEMTHLHYEIHYNGTAYVINAPDGGVVSIVRGVIRIVRKIVNHNGVNFIRR